MKIERTTAEEAKLLGETKAGTLMGELLRRYWWPIAISADLTTEPTLIRLLSEDLVLFRDRSGSVGLLDAHCAHRRANLCFGRVTDKGLRCRYHGWLYDHEGTVLEIPSEPNALAMLKNERQKSYPVEELGGLLFAYMGPLPAPPIPRYHFLVADGQRNAQIQAFNHSNWLQSAENGVDVVHPTFLHSDVWETWAAEPAMVWFEETERGCIAKTVRAGRHDGEFHYMERPTVLPGLTFSGDPGVSFGADETLGQYPVTSARWSVPVDDTMTMNVRLSYRPNGQALLPMELRGDDLTSPVTAEPYKEYQAGKSVLGYTLPSQTFVQDVTILDSLGPIVDRENEHPGAQDRGILMLRRQLLDNAYAVKAGKDPVNSVRTGASNEMEVISGIYRWIDTAERDRLVGAAPETAFVSV